MTISVTELKARCLEIIRQVERDGKVVEIARRGEVVARLLPANAAAADAKPWEKLRGTGVLLATAEESVLEDSDFEALR
jgi:prevent-host-death family protein